MLKESDNTNKGQQRNVVIDIFLKPLSIQIIILLHQKIIIVFDGEIPVIITENVCFAGLGRIGACMVIEMQPFFIELVAVHFCLSFWIKIL